MNPIPNTTDRGLVIQALRLPEDTPHLTPGDVIHVEATLIVRNVINGLTYKDEPTVTITARATGTPEVVIRTGGTGAGLAVEGDTGGHEMVVTHDGDVAVYTPVCHEPHGANCRLICAEGCTYYSGIAHDSEGPFHRVPIGWRHRMVDAGECHAVAWLEEDPGATPGLAEDGTDLFEIGRFPIRPVWTGCGVEWQRVTRPIDTESGGSAEWLKTARAWLRRRA